MDNSTGRNLLQPLLAGHVPFQPGAELHGLHEPGALVFLFHVDEIDQNRAAEVAQALGEAAQPLGMVGDALDRIAGAFDPAGDGIERNAVVEMGGRDFEDTDHMVTESMIRGFYSGYRKIMGL